MTIATPLVIFALLAAAASLGPATAQPGTARVGVVVMHGKGGSPSKHVAELAAALEAKGYLVANLEMPWSGRRNYDAPVAAAEDQVESALKELRAKGAGRLFIAGHSQGGSFALYFGGRHPVDGIVAIAPGGNAASPSFRARLGASVAHARELIAAGKGNEPAQFLDFEGSKGTYPISCAPANYLSWFDPDGAMNELQAAKNMNPQVPVLFIAPLRDYPPLRSSKQMMFTALPANPLTKLYEPDASHLEAPNASIEESARWTAVVAACGAAHPTTKNPPPPRAQT
jgi:pimeloyl-ACP methyl ester carboxylesterase